MKALLLLLLLLLARSCRAASPCDNMLWGIQAPETNPMLVRLGPLPSPTISVVGPSPACFDLTLDTNTDTLYCIDSAANNRLQTINKATGAGTIVGPLNIGQSITLDCGLAFDPNTNTLYLTTLFNQ